MHILCINVNTSCLGHFLNTHINNKLHLLFASNVTDINKNTSDML